MFREIEICCIFSFYVFCVWLTDWLTENNLLYVLYLFKLFTIIIAFWFKAVLKSRLASHICRIILLKWLLLVRANYNYIHNILYYNYCQLGFYSLVRLLHTSLQFLGSMGHFFFNLLFFDFFLSGFETMSLNTIKHGIGGHGLVTPRVSSRVGLLKDL